MAEGAHAIPKRHTPVRLAVLVSGGGTTLQNLADHVRSGRLKAQLAVAIASNAASHGKLVARNLGVPVHLVDRKTFPRDTAAPGGFSERVWQLVREAQADLVCLAGFLSLLTIPADYRHRVLNIHPALLPAFGGQGMHGHHVHEAVLRHGAKVSGCTVHFADDTYDTGPILVQRACPVLDDDTPETLAARVFEQECVAYPEAIRLIAEGRVVVAGRRTRVLPGERLPSEADEALVRDAASFAAEAHGEQQRDGGEPYANHPFNVARILVDRGVVDAGLIAAAYLHDTVEDTPVTRDALRQRFGSRVADLVSQMTLSPEEQKDFETKKRALLEHARKMTSDAKLIKLADRLDNMRDLHRRPPEKQGRYAEATIELLDALHPWPKTGDAIASEIRTLVAKHLHGEC